MTSRGAPAGVADAAPSPPFRVLRRTSDGRLLAGVAAGLAEHLGLAPIVLRVAFVLLTLTGGIGIALYGAFWVFVPQDDEVPGGSGRNRGQLLALAAVGIGTLLLLDRIGFVHGHGGAWPLGAVVVGVALVWRQADESQRARWRATASGPRGLARIAAGAVLLVAGLAGFLASRGELGAARDGLVATAVVVTGLVVLTAPYWRGMTSDLRAERRERIRSQERAEVAAHVHDSVLQTLALIQKAADDPREVTRLARGQERELRGWLYRPTGDPQQTFAASLEQAAAEVEEAHRTPVEVVVVGDCPAEPRLGALVAAAREAMVNAAKHSGADQVRVYAEVEEERVTVYVRDRGMGFDPAAVGPDRFGLAESVVGRMHRNDGTVEVRSTPGEGTEVTLEVSRD